MKKESQFIFISDTNSSLTIYSAKFNYQGKIICSVLHLYLINFFFAAC